MKRLILPLLFALAAHGAETDHSQSMSLDQKHIKQAAMALVEDVVPHPPISDEMTKISNKQSLAIFGAIFGDAQIGALIAVKSDADKAESDADLCLLLWQDGWKFVQVVGKVSSRKSYLQDLDWDWGIKRRVPNGAYYVINSFDLNAISYREHLSWLCDPQTHSLRPTGWPKDALASISGTTITFQRCEKSGYAPTVFEIDQFDGGPGKAIATYSNTYAEGHRVRITISIPDPTTGKRVTWRISEPPPKYEPYHDRFSLSYRLTDGKLEPFHEDATVDVQWEQGQYPTNAISFLIWRLSGIEKTAQLGQWDEDILRERKAGRDNLEIKKPLKTVVAGIPEAVKAFSWPPSQVEEKP